MTYLPIDYYILLQKGYKKTAPISTEDEKSEKPWDKETVSATVGRSMPRTNLVMFNNLPVLNTKSTFYNKSNKIIKTITFEDVYRCLEKSEAKRMLSNATAEQEMEKLLVKYFGGSIQRVEFINYDAERIVRSFHSPSGSLGKDHLNEFQQFIDYSQSKD